MANYNVYTQDDLTKWWFTQAGSGGKLSDLLDDFPLGPAIWHMDADNAWTAGAGSEWYVATSTKPDTVQENLAGWRSMTNVTDDTMGSLNADEWCYDTGNNRVYIRLSDSSDPNATDVRKHYAWDGSGAGPAVMTELIEDAIYQIHLAGDIGDGSTTTSITIKNEHVYCDTNVDWPIVKANATLIVGEANDDYGINGAGLSLAPSGSINMCDGGDIEIYDSRILNRVDQIIWFDTGNFKARMTTFCGNWDVLGGNNNRIGMAQTTMTTYDIKRCNFNNIRVVNINVTPDNFEDCHSNATDLGIGFGGDGEKVIPNFKCTNYTTSMVFNFAGAGLTSTVKFKNPAQAITDVNNQGTGTQITQELYTVDINVIDIDGNPIQDVSVACEDKNGAAAFTTQTTDASGDITQQSVKVTDWLTTSDTETDYFPFVFTISKAGYRTRIIRNITIASPVDWQIVLEAGPSAFAQEAWR